MNNYKDLLTASAWAFELKKFSQPSKFINSFRPLLVDQYGRWLPRVGQPKTIKFRRYNYVGSDYK